MLRTVFISFLLSLTPLFSLGAVRITELPVCEAALIGRPFTEAELTGPHPVKSSDLTVTVKAQQNNYDGTRQFILKRKGRHWASSHTPDDFPNAPVGSPYNFAIMMGSPLAHFFGYLIVDDKHILVPSIEALNAKIDELSRRLVARGEKPIPSRFYFTAGLEDGDRYNQEFAANGAFPISEDPVLFLHDLSFHLGTMAMPPELMMAAQKVTKAVNLFAEELKRFRPKATYKENIAYRWAQGQLVENESQIIDLLFGNIVGLYTQGIKQKNERALKPDARKSDDDDDDDDELYEGFAGASVIQGEIWKFFTEQRRATLRTVVQERFVYMLSEVMYWSENPKEAMTEEEILAILNERLEMLIKKTPDLDWNSPIPQFNAVEIFAGIEKRIAAMKATAETP